MGFEDPIKPKKEEGGESQKGFTIASVPKTGSIGFDEGEGHATNVAALKALEAEFEKGREQPSTAVSPEKEPLPEPTPPPVAPEPQEISFSDLHEPESSDTEGMFAGSASRQVDPVDHAEDVADLRKVVEAFKNLKSPATPDADLLETFGGEREVPSTKSERGSDKGKGSEVKKEPPNLAEKVGVREGQQAMREAEEKYLTAYKAFYKNNGWLARQGKERLNTKETKELAELKGVYNETRLAYGRALEISATRRLLSSRSRYEGKYRRLLKENTIKKDEMGAPISFEEYFEKYGSTDRLNRVKERYNRLVRFNEVVRPGAEKEIQARVESLDAKGQNLFTKGLVLLSRGNQVLEKKYGKTGAQAIRAAATTTLIAVGSAGVGAFGFSSLLAATGYGALRFGRTVFATGVGANIGALYGRTLGEKGQRKAKEKVKSLGRSGSSINDMSANDLAQLDRERARTISEASDASAQRKRQWVTALTAFGVGAGTAAALAELTIFQDASEVIAAAPPEEPTAPPSLGAAEIGRFPNSPLSGAAVESPLEAPMSSQANPSISVSIHEKGQGANQLFLDLKQALREQGYTVENAPSEDVRRILSEKVTELSKHYNFINSAGESRYMHVGDIFTVDDQGNFISKNVGESFQPAPTPPMTEEAITRDLNLRELERVQEAPLEPEAPPPSAVEALPSAVPPVEAPAEMTVESPPESVSVTPRAYGLSAESFVNAHNVQVDPSVSTLFADSRGAVSVYGGTYETQEKLAKQFLLSHPGATVRIMIEEANGKPSLRTLTLVPTPNAGPLFRFAPADELPANPSLFKWLGRLFARAPKLDPQDFINQIKP